MQVLFDPINPDKDTVKTREWTRGEKLDNEFWLLQQLEDVMDKANFHEMPKETVHQLLAEHEAREGVQVRIYSKASFFSIALSKWMRHEMKPKEPRGQNV